MIPVVALALLGAQVSMLQAEAAPGGPMASGTVTAPGPPRALDRLASDVHDASAGTAGLSTNWAGYVETGSSFHGVSGTWTVPPIPPSNPSAASQWVGIGGATGADLMAGTEEEDISGVVSYFAWYDLLGAPPVNIGPVYPDDQITFSIDQNSGTSWQLTDDDHTDNMGGTGPIPSSYSGPDSSAEWLEGDPTVGAQPPLANFGTTPFSGVGFSSTGPSAAVGSPVDMADSSGDIIAYPSPMTSNSFTVSYGAPPAPPPPPAPCPATSGAPLGSAAGIAAIDVSGCLGYYVADAAGQVSAFGAAQFKGDLSGITLNAPIISIAATADGGGYWLLGADGGIYAFGDARFFGSTGGLALNAPIVSMAPTPDGSGYWLVAKDGGIFSYGDAAFYGSTGGISLNQPVDGMAVGPGGTGYWLVASDGGVFAFHEPFVGSLGSTRLNKPIIGMSSGPAGTGYTLVGSDGGVFTFASPFYGSLGANPPAAPIVALATVPGDSGYYLIDAAGHVYAFGSAVFFGNAST
jgi:hypothetical protein